MNPSILENKIPLLLVKIVLNIDAIIAKKENNLGFLNIFKKNEKLEQEEFISEILKTSNVSHSLSEISKKYNISLSNLDFDILSIDTFVKMSKEEDFVLTDDETMKLIEKNKLFLNEDFEIKQSYEIKIKRFQFIDDFELIGKLKVNKDLTHAIYSVSTESILNYDEYLEAKLINELNKKKLKSGMLIKIPFFEVNFLNDIKHLVATIRVLGIIEEDINIELCKAITPIKPIKLEVIEHYKIHKKKYAKSKDFIYPIKKEDVIIEVIKPQEGKNGRSCRGKLIKVENVSNMEIPEYKIDMDVTRKDSEESIFYVANKDGYVYINENVINIKDEIEVNEISLKTGHVKGAEDSNVKLEVKESGVLKEAIKDGMIVETTELVVKGNVGSGAKIKAKILEIDGQTHKKSKILAQNAEIHTHKGYLKANYVIIDRLEGGVIEAKEVYIKQAISGKIRAKKIKIELLGSHLVLYASHVIEIDNLKGNENKFIIDEAILDNKDEYVDELEDIIKELNIKIRRYKKQFKDNKKVIMKNKSFINTLKSKVKQQKNENLDINPVFIQKIKKFNDFVKKTKELEYKIKKLIDKVESIKLDLNNLQRGVFLAKIISHNGFREFNRIEFHLIEPQMKIVYDTKKSDKDTNIFVLKDYGEMDYKIVGEKE